MSHFVINYCAPIEDITDKQKFGLTAYALDNHEWMLLGQLRDVLKVCLCFGEVDVTL